MAHGGAVLWLRMLTLYVVAQVSSKQKVMFVKEQPQDPGEYRPDSHGDCVSVWRFQEWRTFARKYKMHLVRCDQALGASEEEADNVPYLDHLNNTAGAGRGGTVDWKP